MKTPTSLMNCSYPVGLWALRRIDHAVDFGPFRIGACNRLDKLSPLPDLAGSSVGESACKSDGVVIGLRIEGLQPDDFARRINRLDSVAAHRLLWSDDEGLLGGADAGRLRAHRPFVHFQVPRRVLGQKLGRIGFYPRRLVQ